jgi:hypothetical protein
VRLLYVPASANTALVSCAISRTHTLQRSPWSAAPVSADTLRLLRCAQTHSVAELRQPL